MSKATLYTVVHLRFKAENRHREVQKTISERWFSNLPDAKVSFQRIHSETIQYMVDPKGESRQRDSKQLYKLELGAKAKTFSIKHPHCDAERLAHELKLDATAGALLVEKSKKHAAAVKS